MSEVTYLRVCYEYMYPATEIRKILAVLVGLVHTLRRSKLAAQENYVDMEVHSRGCRFFV